MATHRVNYEGRDYIWDGHRWCDAKTYIIPPENVVQKLNFQIREHREAEDNVISEFQPLLDAAKEAHMYNELPRAENFVRRALKLRPGDRGALAVLCSILRARNSPEQAILEVEPFLVMWYEPLLTTYAAALCDLERWEEAKQVIERGVGFSTSYQMQQVIQRIKNARPDLYPGE